ncbi:MAG: (d)CMP kinase [Pseudomonadota bacterium]|nr:(d)CMP kinase [Pseudomonadota bacterium]
MAGAAHPPPVIAVDGPGGVGKGTLCRHLARTLGWHLLDSGSLYRLTALAAGRRGLVLTDAGAVAEVARTLNVQFEEGRDETRIVLEGEDVTDLLRSETCGNAASQVAALPAVRAALLQCQRDFRRPPGLVADGRDMGSVVFPAAEVKIFLTASPEERAARRYKQLREKGLSVSLPTLVKEIAERDQRDAGRPVAPLRPAAEAVIVDTTGLGIDAVRQRALAIVRERLALPT